jgi:hypothetical protein
MAQPVPLPDPGDRRSGTDRRVTVLPFPTERRRGDRRNGADRRGAQLSTDTHLRVALEHLIRAAEDSSLEDVPLRLVDNAVLRIWAALEALGER